MNYIVLRITSIYTERNTLVCALKQFTLNSRLENILKTEHMKSTHPRYRNYFQNLKITLANCNYDENKMYQE